MNSNTLNANAMTTNKNKQHLYRIIWRWHFYAGIFCIPFIITLSISGAIFLFKPQIDAWIDKPFHQLAIQNERASPDEHIAAALSAIPNSTFLNYELPQSDQHAVIISVASKGIQHLVYIDPYSLAVLKTTEHNKQFIQLVRTFHGELLGGNVGSVLIELAGCWAIVLIITGLYLWWPRSAKGFAGILYPRLNQGKRILWRDLHATTGIWISFLALFLLITGLPWALVWGSAFKEVRQFSFQNSTNITQPATAVHDHNDMESAMKSAKPLAQDWSTGRQDENQILSQTDNNLTPHLSTDVYSSASSLKFSPPVEISISRNDPSVWTVSSQHQNRMLRSTAWINSETGHINKVENFSDKSTLDKTIGIGIAAHEGQLFGWFNQLLGLLTTLGLLLMSISAFVLWRSRKPEKVLGAPSRFPNSQVSKGVVCITLVLALFLPLLAISLIALTVFEFFIFRRIPKLQGWLGLQKA